MINDKVDYTFLKPYATDDELKEFLRGAITYKPYAVCVFPSAVLRAKIDLKDTGIKICTVVGFPFGNYLTSSKVVEASVIGDAVDEIDMVMNYQELKSGKGMDTYRDILAVRKQAKKDKAILKVIIETCYLTEEEKRLAIEICLQAGVDFIKTSTGYGSGGATIEDIKLIKSMVGDDCKIKASGGIKTVEFAQQLIDAGADRIGSSSQL